MEGVPLPHPLFHDRVVEVAVLVNDELALARVLRHLGDVGAHEELALEQLHPDDREHEHEEQRHEHDVADGLDGDDDALDDVLEAFGTIDGTERAKHT